MRVRSTCAPPLFFVTLAPPYPLLHATPETTQLWERPSYTSVPGSPPPPPALQPTTPSSGPFRVLPPCHVRHCVATAPPARPQPTPNPLAPNGWKSLCLGLAFGAGTFT